MPKARRAHSSAAVADANVAERSARRGGGEAPAQVAAQIGMKEALHVDERVDHLVDFRLRDVGR